MKKSFLTALLAFLTVGATSVYGQFVNPVVGGNVTLTDPTNNVVFGPLPITSTNLYLNSTNSSTVLSIDNSYTPPAHYPATNSVGINFNILGSTKYKIFTSTLPVCPSGYFHVMPVTGPGIHMNGTTMSFTDINGLCSNTQGLPGSRYIFDSLTAMNRLYVGNLNSPYPILNPKYKFYVGGSMICEELVVKLKTSWADYVFASDYTLMPLGDVKKFIASNSHLPGVPTAAEIEQNGIATGDMLTIQMKKIEELTLYLIQMEERIKQLEIQSNMLQNTNGQ